MERIGDVLKPPARTKKKKQTERGDLFDFFLSKLNPPRVKSGYKPLSYAQLAFHLTKIPTKDLYALRSRCDDAEGRGKPWGAIFWITIRPYDPSKQSNRPTKTPPKHP